MNLAETLGLEGSENDYLELALKIVNVPKDKRLTSLGVGSISIKIDELHEMRDYWAEKMVPYNIQEKLIEYLHDYKEYLLENLKVGRKTFEEFVMDLGKNSLNRVKCNFYLERINFKENS